MSKLSNRNKDIYENRPEELVSLTIRIPHDVHKLILETTKAMLFRELSCGNKYQHEAEVAKEFVKWRENTEEGRSAGLKALNIAVQTSQLAAQKYLREEFFKCKPELKKHRTRSPTGYSRENLGRVVTEALEIAGLKLRNRYRGE